MSKIKDLLKQTKEKGASDLHLCVGLPPIIRCAGNFEKLRNEPLKNDDIAAMVKDILPKEKQQLLEEGGISTNKDVDIGIEVEGIARFRTNIYRDKNGFAIAFRLIPSEIKSLKENKLPPIVESICSMKSGLTLVTGITGSGKSTTLASILDKINSDRAEHIITIEDPIEFIHHHKKSIVNQREIGTHTASFSEALRSALREDPDVILVGEMRDLETIAMAITAAETGHLVLSTIHTRGAAQTIDRIIDAFPSHQQNQIRGQLADALIMVVSQVLIPSTDGKSRHLACEVMVANSAVKGLIREKKAHQIYSTIQTSAKAGMQTLDTSLKALVDAGKVRTESVRPWAFDQSKFA